SDGGFEDTSVATDTRIWTTAYVVPAALGKTWGEILGSFQKPVQDSQNKSNINASQNSTSSIATSTLESASSTVTVSTTILDFTTTLIPATSTATTTSIATSTLVSASSTVTVSTTILDFTTTLIPATSTATTTVEILPQVTANIPEVKNKNEQNLLPENLENPAQQNEPAQEDYSKNLTAQISNSVNSGRSNNTKTINTIFYFSLGVVSLLGLCLVIKFLIFKP
ncbi:MAG: hypothetical protein AAB723_03500, partial [Patescibacteria group bacterium]